MKVFFVASALCLVIFAGQSSGIRITHTEAEAENINENFNLKIHEKEIIRPIPEPVKRKEKVFVNRSKPLYVTGKSRHVVIPASKPIIVKPEAVVIRQKGDVEVRPIHITKQPPPLIVTKKIVKLHQPVIKKYYVEKYRKHEEGCPEHIVSQKISKKTCDCPISEHVLNSKYDWEGERSIPSAVEVDNEEQVRNDDVEAEVIQDMDETPF
ncbi:hypothetical protein Bhyg_13453 [Pseudolycoriella hygida]|uniref:Uncharacterized protein n=1 Tax=Pseudolycoriella hygida TaxID=35572 RepID=A0A9Q0RWD6_9DIPT|nr:hypothetical protein Bhyg_13453 [Pseudolycoriella hygida]